MVSGLRTYHVKKLGVFASPDQPVRLPPLMRMVADE
jgi:hypothetical protein